MSNPFKRDAGPDRYSGMVRSVRTRGRKHMRHRWQWIVLAIFLVLLAGGGYGLWLYSSTLAKIHVKVRGVTKESKGRPFNTLLVGSDSRAGLTKKEQLDLGASATGIAGKRADTLIVAHVDPVTNRVTMVQFPRDLWVPIPGHGHNRVNSALEGGKSELVRTIEKLTGLPINHYAEINIAGFRDLVDAIGGVDVCVGQRIPFDPATGIEVKHPGMIHFGGDRALRFVRSRKVFATGDLARIENQQKFLSAAIDKITSVGTLLNPGRIRAVIGAAGDNLRIDEGTSPLDLYHLGQRFRTFDPDHYEAYTVPNLGPGNVGAASVIVPDFPAMKVMFAALKRNRSPAAADGVPGIAPGTIDVGVLNGTSVPGAAQRAASRLEKATEAGGGPVRIAASNIGNASRFGFRHTVIRYARGRPRTKRMAALVAAAIPGARVTSGRIAPGVDVSVIVGRGFKTHKIEPLRPIPIPQPGRLPRVCRA